MDHRLKKWIRWMVVIHDDIQAMLINRNIFWDVQKIIKRNRRIQKPSHFYDYLGKTYVAYVTVGIRRQVKINSQSVSFARLLTEIGETPEVLSRAYYKDLYKGSIIESRADAHFDKISGGKGDCVSENMIKRDLRRLKAKAIGIEDFADKRIAHHDRKDPRTLPTFADVDKALNLLDKMYVKYHLLFHAVNMKSLMPTYQYDWKEIFKEPWVRSR